MPKLESYHKGIKNNILTRIKLLWSKRNLPIIFWAVILFFVVVVGIFVYLAKDLPSPNNLTERRLAESTKIYDRTGQVVLYDVHGEEKRTVISFNEIPQNLKDAVITAEDDNFYHHLGIDFKGIIRAFLADLRGQTASQGGSTITQQLVKNAILTSEKTLSRKIKEAILAIELEIKYSKDEILNLYLNQIPFGSNAYGVEAAAQTFFSKNAKDLTLAQSAALAAMLKATTYYSPYGSHLTELKSRQEYILDRMYGFGYVTKEELDNAKAEDLFSSFAPTKANIKAPHFVMYIKEHLEEKYGKDYMETAGLKVYTTLDWDLQQIAEDAVAQGATKNGQKYNAQNAALTAIDPKTGEILAMVGSKDYWAESYPKGCTPGKNCLFEPNVNVATRLRQPGSSFKPFAYATAFEKGFTPDTIIFDLPTEFSSYIDTCPLTNIDYNNRDPLCYHPRNYDGKFRGPVTMRSGLAQSLNVPSVKTLYLAGVDDTINLAQDMGIETLKDRSRYNLSLVLGGGEVKLLEETAAFGVFANEGVRNPIQGILKIENSDGDIIEQYKSNPQKVLEPQIARLISDILSDDNARAPIFGAKSSLYVPGIPVAAKTGTTQEYRDGWTVGYTPSLAVGVWTGNNDNTPVNREPGAIIAAPIWNDFIKHSYAKKLETNKNPGDKPLNYFALPDQPEEFIKPDAITTNKDMLNGSYVVNSIFKIDKFTGKLANDSTPQDAIEEKIYPQIHSLLYYTNKNDPDAESNGKDDPQFQNWEQPVLNWVNALDDGFLYNQLPQN